MAKLEIKEEGGEFVLYDDGLKFDSYGTFEDADEQKRELEAEEVIADAVSDAVDEMMDALRAKFPHTSNGKLRELVVENL
jgi:hypothetical protein